MIRVERILNRVPKSYRSILGLTFLVIAFVLLFVFLRPGYLSKSYIKYKTKVVPMEHSLEFRNGQFFLKGKKTQFFSGSMHYFRILPEYWQDRLVKLKAAGLNTVETYVAWNLHEQHRGFFNFEGRLNIRRFIELAHGLGLYVIVRPGPYICSEWEFGGLPSWLLNDPHMKLRADYQPYLDATERYLEQLSNEIIDLQYGNGGPIVAFQIENEYGSYGDDIEYMMKLNNIMHQQGYHELLFTSDNRDGLEFILPGVLQTINLQSINSARTGFSSLSTLQPGKPVFVMELWSGWFDHWGERHHKTDVRDLREVLQYILQHNGSFNLYMFHGGTNFGFMNGANHAVKEATITSYDYDAPLSESGGLTDKYHMIAELLRPRTQFTDLPPIKVEKQHTAQYGRIPMTHTLGVEELLRLYGEPISSTEPVPMEMLPINNGGGQGYGFIVYQKVIHRGHTLKIQGRVKDRAWIMLNGKLIATVSKDVKNAEIGLTVQQRSNHLDIIVENTGRDNYIPYKKDKFENQRKGIIGTVYLDNYKLENWNIYPLEFSEPFVAKCISQGSWQPVTEPVTVTLPSLWRGELTINTLVYDTHIDTQGWGKGSLFVNDFNLGRYNPLMGPQKTLYLPAPLLKKGKNWIMVFELTKSSNAFRSVATQI